MTLDLEEQNPSRTGTSPWLDTPRSREDTFYL
jgi:hypothetical protein